MDAGVPEAERVIHIHYDDWGLRNLYPLSTQAEVSADLNEAITSGQRDRDPSGLGWTAVHQIQPPLTSYVEAQLTLDDAVSALEHIMPRVRRFRATNLTGRSDGDPFASYEDDAWCFGFGSHCFLRLEPAGDHVKFIWFHLSSSNSSELEPFRRSLEVVDRLVPSVIADYVIDEMVVIGIASAVDRYFSRFAKTAR